MTRRGGRIWAEAKCDGQTNKQTNKQTNRQTNKQTDRQTDKQTLIELNIIQNIATIFHWQPTSKTVISKKSSGWPRGFHTKF